MTLTLRRYLLVLLGLLQLVAPLVHAHSGSGFFKFGLHLPNFEVYSAENYQNNPVFQSLYYLTNLDDAIVSISTGMQNQQNNADDLSPLFYFPPTLFIFSVALASCEINFSPQSLQNSITLVHAPQSPRAPPRLTF
jgi:hypothetical protein